MKVCVLAFDGLEYNLVEKWKLNSLKQKVYGKYPIPKACWIKTTDFMGNRIYEPWTPLVWTAFLTGKLPNQLQIGEYTLGRRKSKLANLLRTFIIKFGLSYYWVNLRNHLRLTRIINIIAGERETSKIPIEQTFLKNKKHAIINFPMLSDGWSLNFPYGATEKIIIQTYHQQFDNLSKQLLDKLQQPWQILVYYTRLLDVVGELAYGNKLELMKAYFKANWLTYKVKQKLPADTILLVISDHGMQPFKGKYGKHTNYGFWSLNIKTDWKPKTITDFHPKIIEWVNETNR